MDQLLSLWNNRNNFLPHNLHPQSHHEDPVSRCCEGICKTGALTEARDCSSHWNHKVSWENLLYFVELEHVLLISTEKPHLRLLQFQRAHSLIRNSFQARTPNCPSRSKAESIPYLLKEIKRKEKVKAVETTQGAQVRYAAGAGKGSQWV